MPDNGARPDPSGGEVARSVEVRGVSKSYARDLRHAQRNGARAVLDDVRGRRETGLRAGEFWALDDISCSVGPGEALGLLGRNGAGKSTFLRIVSGISRPTRGEVECRGRVASVLDVSAGFVSVLSGRENLEVAHTLLTGRRPTAAEVDRIVSYAGIQGAIDHPLRSYSQGMRLRLGFSTAVHVDPDVLVLDEALSVGDTSFQLQCVDFLHAFRKAGGALVFTTHSLWLFQTIATAGIQLDAGRVVAAGTPEEVADRYVADLQQGSTVAIGDGPDIFDRERVIRRDAPEEAVEDEPLRHSGGIERPVRFRRITVSDLDGGPVRSGRSARLTVDVEADESFAAELGFMFWTADLSVCVAADLSHDVAGRGEHAYALRLGPNRVSAVVHDLPLLPGRYALRAAVYDGPTGDVMGLSGFEDTPTWFEVEPGPGTLADDRRPHPLRTFEVGPVETVVDYEAAVGSSAEGPGGS